MTSKEFRNSITEEEMSEDEKKEREIRESVQKIRDISGEEAKEAYNFTPESIKKGDNIFHFTLVGGLIVVGLIMILLGAFVKGMSSMLIGGVLFSAFGIFLDFLSRKIKKD